MFVSCVQPYTTTTACTWPITSSQSAPSSSFDVCLSPVCSPTPQQLHVPGPSPPHNGPPVLPLTYVCLLCAALHHNNCMYLAHHLLTMGPLVLPLTFVCLLCAALHHNNCMYLAHHLLTMGPQFFL